VNKPAGGEIDKVAPVAPAEGPPAASDEWHSVARDWYDALGRSGQSRYYEPSDWAVARYVAEAMSRNLCQGQRMSSQMFAAVMSAMSSLLTTEGDRRRARMEIERGPVDAEVPAEVAMMEKYRAAAGRPQPS
jgi:hypothetical protein